MLIENERDQSIIEHILRYCEQVCNYINRFGKDFKIFTSDSAFRDAVSMDLLQIGELSGRLSEGFMEQYKSEIPWKEVRGMRNLFAHNYIKMNLTIIWETATVSVPILK